MSIFAITEYKAQESTFDKAILDLKIKFEKENENVHQKFCFTYVQLSRLRIFFDLNILEFICVNDVKYQSNHELRTETKRLQKLQKKIMIN
jgi:hypothetical protein